jgi:hypothetical protein
VKDLTELDAYRRRDKRVLAMYGWTGDNTCGVFELPLPKTGVVLLIVASADEGWEHLSVSLPNRTPNWTEMEHAKRTFFKDDETAMQLHVPPKDHKNLHPFTLHIWRPTNGQSIPRPPEDFV